VKIAVIIPFYQRERGILRNAIDSVRAQVLPDGASVWLIVVDDGSPIPARDELAGMESADRGEITLVVQPNGGPGDARNRALDLVADQGADFVAFLDSDDVWKARHLHDAVSVLQLGFDFYFCDHIRFEATQTYASTCEMLQRLKNPETPGYVVVDPEGPVITADHDVLLLANIEDYLCQTSTVVLRQPVAQSLRFDPELRSAGEDYLFWISLVAAGARVAISWRVNVFCGRGVNIYFDSFDFASVKAVDRIGYNCLFWDKCREQLGPIVEKTDVVAKHRRYLRAYSYMFVRAILRGQRPNRQLFRALCLRVPFMPVAMPFRFLAVLPRRRAESKLW
jgi:succinoglycan biosynthesis protein ExoW